MNEKELLKKLNNDVDKIKKDTNRRLIKKHAIKPIFNFNLDYNSIGLSVVLTCGSGFELSNDMLNEWKERFGAENFYIKAEDYHIIVKYMVYYKEK